MRVRVSAFLALGAGIAALAAALEACRQGPAPLGAGPQPGPTAAGAYDVVKLCRSSAEAGPVWFSHSLHAELEDARGARIPCSRCHHDLEAERGSPPRGCNKCHLTHRHEPDAKIRPT
jgi:hypothetical protein